MQGTMKNEREDKERKKNTVISGKTDGELWLRGQS